jgi:hypothetical protein
MGYHPSIELTFIYIVQVDIDIPLRIEVLRKLRNGIFGHPTALTRRPHWSRQRCCGRRHTVYNGLNPSPNPNLTLTLTATVTLTLTSSNKQKTTSKKERNRRENPHLNLTVT